MKNIFFIFLLSFVVLNCKAQLTVSSGVAANYLVDSVLLGPGVKAFNIQYTGAAQARGTFNGINTNLGIKKGVVLSTGKVTDAMGPNNTTSVTSQNGTPGNTQLTQIIGQPTKDAAILEFDFIPSSDTVKFNYVFASEEYYEGVCTPFNDVFAFLINGPGITGTTNIALIPGTTKLVSISSVNGGVLGDPIYGPSTSYTYCALTYTNYYVDNANPPGPTVQYDGFTKLFTAKAKVIPCQTYHIKLAIADGGNDDTWDSAVFLEAGSFNTHYLTVSNQPKITGCIVNSAIAEGSGNAAITFKRYDSIPYPRTLTYTISGTASPSDYQISPSKIYFNPGSDTANLYVTPLNDNIAESVESVSITIIPDFIVCTGWTIPGGVVNIADPPKLKPGFTTLKKQGCEPFCVQFNDTTHGNVIATWTFGDGSPTVMGPVASHCYDTAGIFNIKLSVRTTGGCRDSVTKNNYITVYPKPIAEFINKDKNLNLNDNLGTFNNASSYADKYIWSLNGSYASQDKDLRYEFIDTGCYNIQLIALSNYQCADTVQHQICIDDGFTIWVPNSFSPNNDGLNDVFLPQGTGWNPETYTLEIINRWGITVFKTGDVNNAWDGKTLGSKTINDVYIWKINITDVFKHEHELTGHVMVLR